MWAFEQDTENSISFKKDDIEQFQMIRDNDINEYDMMMARKIVEALNKESV